MRINQLIILILSGFIFSCKPPKEEDEKIPENIIGEEQFAKILTDGYLAESASGLNVKNVSAQKFDSTYLFNPIKENDIRKSQFDSSLIYYTEHPKKLKSIYDQVLEKLSQFQAMVEMEKAMNPGK